MVGMPGLHLAGACLVAWLAAGDEPPILGEAPLAGSSDGTGPTTGDATTGTSGSGTTGTGTGTSGTGTGTGTGTATDGTTSVGTTGGSDSSGSDSTATTDDTGASTTSPTTTATDSGGSFVEGDITGISYGYEDFEDGCDVDDDDDDPGCCDSEQNNSDNFCHISRHGRDRVAIAVLLILLARPRRARR
jgi:hypothetical protein